MLADGRTAERTTHDTADHYHRRAIECQQKPQTNDKRHIREIAEPAGTQTDGRPLSTARR